MQDTEQMRAEFLRIQNSLKDQLDLTDRFAPDELRTIAGVDLAYWKNGDEEYAVCCIIVIDLCTHEVIAKSRSCGKITVPYMPGFLAFRELPLVEAAAAKLAVKPDLYMFDGNGCLHPRHMGIASHASFLLNAPTIGVAKTYFRVRPDTDCPEPEQTAGSWCDIIVDGITYGRVLRTHDGVKPVFVSAGNHICLDTAVRLTMQLVNHESRIPIPTRLADLETHIARDELSCRNLAEI